MIAGPANGPGDESLGVVVSTPRWLERWVVENGPTVGRHYLIVSEWDEPRIRVLSTDLVESEKAPTWAELGERISRIGHWALEDYQEYVLDE